MLIEFKHFHRSLNIALISAPGCEFFFAKCDQFFYHLQNEPNEEHFSGTFIIHFLDKPYHEINFKSHLSSVLLCR